jgi:hypothetical protein
MVLLYQESVFTMKDTKSTKLENRKSETFVFIVIFVVSSMS